MNNAGVQARKYRLAGIGLMMLAVAAVGITFNMRRRAARSETELLSATTARTNARGGGPVYPYSVIPGGVQSASELRRAVERDSVASGHYKGFAVEKARLEIVSRSRLVFVSYRIKDHVYWTRKRIRLRQGETILNDGVYQARTRCGNRIADTPQQEHGKEEPSEQELDTPVAAESMAAVAAPYLEKPAPVEWSHVNPIPVTAPGITVSSPKPGTIPVGVFIPSPEGPLPSLLVPLPNLPVAEFPGSNSETPDLFPSEVSEVRAPEPSTWIQGLLGTLLLSTGLRVRRRRAKQR